MEMYQDDYLDEYEEDGEEQEEEEAEEEYEEEKEDPKPSKEELEYLALRQRLKESLRKQMKKENGTSFSNSKEKKKLPYDNYGSFFGPSQPVIAQRVIQESKSLLENQHLAAKGSNSNNNCKKIPASANSQTKPAVRRDVAPRVVNEEKLKVQKLKEMRDYSFLLSDDAELPVPKKEQPPRKISVSNSDARPAQVPKSRVSISNLSKTVANGRDGRKAIPTNHSLQTKTVHHQVGSGSKRPNMSSEDPRKQLGRTSGSGPGRPVGPKALLSKSPASTKPPIPKNNLASTLNKKVSLVGAKKPVPGLKNALLTKSNPSVQKQHLEQRRDLREPEKAKHNSKMPISLSRPQVLSRSQIKPPRQMLPRVPVKEGAPKKRPPKPFMDDDDEEVDPFAEIRKLFRYNRQDFAGVDEDDSDMEATFDDIQREERLSAKIAKDEDERELKLIEEEERRERLRKKRKLSQH